MNQHTYNQGGFCIMCGTPTTVPLQAGNATCFLCDTCSSNPLMKARALKTVERISRCKPCQKTP